MVKWYYEHNGKAIGPMSTRTMWDWLQQKKMQPAQLVRREGETEWKPASGFPELIAETAPPDEGREVIGPEEITMTALVKVVLIAVVLAAVGGFGLEYYLVTTDRQEAEGDNPSAPKFDKTSNGPVLLRYAFKSPTKFDETTETAAKVTTSAGRKESTTRVAVKTTLTLNVVWVAPDGKAFISAVATGATMSVEGAESTDYDSAANRPPKEPLAKALSAMIKEKVAFTFSVTPRGELSELDLSSVKDACGKAGIADSFDSVEKTIRDGLNLVFMPLPEKPVSVGDVFPVGPAQISETAAGPMKSELWCKVTAISADQKQVALDTVTAMGIEKSLLKRMNSDGWVLFNLGRGSLESNYAGNRMVVWPSASGKGVKTDFLVTSDAAVGAAEAVTVTVERQSAETATAGTVK